MKKFLIIFLMTIVGMLATSCTTPPTDNSVPTIEDLRGEYIIQVENRCSATTSTLDSNSREGRELASWYNVILDKTKADMLVAETEDELELLKNNYISYANVARSAYESDITRYAYSYKMVASGEVDGKAFSVTRGEPHPFGSARFAIKTTSSDPELEFAFVTDKYKFVTSGDPKAMTVTGDALVGVQSSDVEDGYIGVIIKANQRIYGFVDVGYHTDSATTGFEAYTFTQDAWETVTEDQIIERLMRRDVVLPEREPCLVERVNHNATIGDITVKQSAPTALPQVTFESVDVAENGITYDVTSATGFMQGGEIVYSASVTPGQTVELADGIGGGISAVVKRGDEIVGVVAVSANCSEDGAKTAVSFVAYELSFNVAGYKVESYPNLYEDFIIAIVNCYSI